jgi:hypothetical protein
MIGDAGFDPSLLVNGSLTKAAQFSIIPRANATKLGAYVEGIELWEVNHAARSLSK